jgi:hypothetical protein
MTPALIPRPDANTLLEANLTKDGKKTTAAPKAVAKPAPITRAKATGTLGLSTVMIEVSLWNERVEDILWWFVFGFHCMF